MYYSYFCIYIQKIVRKVLIKNYITLHGPGFYNRKVLIKNYITLHGPGFYNRKTFSKMQKIIINLVRCKKLL